MKNLICSLAVAAIAFTTLSPSAHADVMSDGINLTINGAAVVGTYNKVAQDYTFSDVITTLGIANPITGLLSESVSTITGTYTDVSGILGTLAIADVCEGATVLGSRTPACSNLAIVASDTGLGPVTAITGPAGSSIGPLGVNLATLTLLGADITLLPDGHRDLGLVTLSIGSADGSFNFGPPPPPPSNNSPVPEPGSLSLMATGLLAAAGAVRRRFIA